MYNKVKVQKKMHLTILVYTKAHRTLYDPTGLKVVRLTDFGYEITNRENFARVVFISDPKSVSRTTEIV